MPAQITGTTYYVSPTGSDDSLGTDPGHAWRSVARVNRAALRPGDGVLFQGGATFGDASLMPAVSGTAGRPVVFGSYGQGRPSFPQAVWFKDRDHLVFQNLAVKAPTWQGIQGTGNHITVQGCRVEDVRIGIHAHGFDWKIHGNELDRVDDSGMILVGESQSVTGNLITNTGLDETISWGKHGIYLKVAGARITNNVIRSFSDSGVSARYRNSVIEHNRIGEGPIGIGWYQYDALPGTSYWRYNEILGTTAASIYVSAGADAGPTRESFVISHNLLSRSEGRYLHLNPTAGSYAVADNTQR